MKNYILLAETGLWKSSSVACGLSSIKIHYSVNRINEVYVFSIKYCYIAYFIEKTNFICFFCYCFGMVSVTKALHYATSASHYQGRPSMYIRGLILQNLTRLF